MLTNIFVWVCVRVLFVGVGRRRVFCACATVRMSHINANIEAGQPKGQEEEEQQRQ